MGRFDSSVTDIHRLNAIVRIGFPPLLGSVLSRHVIALTIGRRIWVAPAVLEGDRGSAALLLLLRHELVHVAQYQRDGIPLFLVRYLLEYFRNRIAGMRHYDAYRSISYEEEAWNRGESSDGETML